MPKPVRAKLYGTEEGLLREVVKHSVTLDLDNYPRAELNVPLNLENYDHQGQRFIMSIDGGPPESLSTYEHSGAPFSVSKSERSKSRWEKIKETLSRRKTAEVNSYLAESAEEALDQIEGGATLFEIRGKNGEGKVKAKGEPVRLELEDRGEYLERLKAVEELTEENKILDNDLLKSQKSKYLGCSHYAKTGEHTSPYKTWKDFENTDIEVAAHMDVGLDHPVAIGYLGDRYRGEPDFGYRLMNENGAITPSEYSKEEETVARELEGVVNRVGRPE